jgi:signal transduction histidine kinase
VATAVPAPWPSAAAGTAHAAAAIALDVSVVQVQAISGRLLFWRVMESAVADLHTEERWPPEQVQVRIDQQVAERTHDLEERDRRKDEFLATLSHEMRTPLYVISGYASLLRAGVLKGDASTKAIAAIERNATMQAQLVADLLDVSRIAAGRLSVSMRPLDFCHMVEAVVGAIAPLLATKEIEVDYQRCVSARVLGDERRLQQVVSNLLSNAVKFTPTGGTIAVSLALSGTSVVLTVSDTGIGIRPEFKDQLFRRFAQDESSIAGAHGGLGLGLSIVRHLVELHHGTVRADSAGAGLGSSFIVELPLLDE